MFICKECLERDYKNTYCSFSSVGKCESCGEHDLCADIPSFRLIPKGVIFEQTIVEPKELRWKKRENNNMEKQIRMSLETAREWYKLSKEHSVGTPATKWLLENFTKEELDGDNGFTWEDSFDNTCFKIIDGVIERVNCKVRDSNKDCFKTEAQAKSALAFAQLSHIVSKYNSKREYFSCCSMITGDLKISITNIFGAKSEQHLGFYEYKDAETSLRVNNDLWKQYWMI